MLHDLLLMLAVSVGLNLVLFLVAFRFKTDRLTDASYAATFLALVLYGLWRGGADWPKLLLVAMVCLWAARLGSFLLYRIWHTGTDTRFDGVRNNFWKFGKFWLAQGVSVWVILLPAILLLRSAHAFFMTGSAIGLCVWAAGITLEAAADIQKYRFSRNPANKGKWIDEGVWRWSRHPNYFGEMLVWTGVYLLCVDSLSGVALWIGALSPLYIICLLLFVSGLPPLEKGADKRWGHLPAYQAYKRRTNVLFPWPPKK